MSEAPLYICIDCELASEDATPVALNEHSLCPRCGSSSVVPVDTLRELDARRKREQLAPLDSTPDTRKRVQAMKDQRFKDSQPLRLFLLQRCNSKEQGEAVAKALREWDGWAFHVYYPWLSQAIEDNPAPGHFVVELINGVKNGPRWIITLDSNVVDVKSFQNGAD